MTNIKLGILGCGAIGSAISNVHSSFKQEIIEHDIKLNSKLTDLLNADVIFVCLPTPQSSTGHCDLSIVEGELDNLSELGYEGTVVMKSTVPPMTGMRYSEQYKFDYISCPEFLREHCAISDYLNQKVHFVGSDCDISIMKKVLAPLSSNIRQVSITEAELIKYFHNTYNAWRIIFANAFCDLAESMDTNYDTILSSICDLNGISDSYLKSSKAFKGFGGPCLPKDTAALAQIANQLGLRSNVWDFCIRENEKWDTTLIDGLRASGFDSKI